VLDVFKWSAAVAVFLFVACGPVEPKPPSGTAPGAICGRVTVASSDFSLGAQQHHDRLGGSTTVHADDVLLDASFQGTLTVQNDGVDEVRVVLDPGSDTRINLQSAQGDIAAGASLPFAVSVDADGLPLGVQQRALTVRWSGGSFAVALIFQVVTHPPDRAVQVVAFVRDATG